MSLKKGQVILSVMVIWTSSLAAAASMKDLYDDKHGVKMGVPNGGCDDAKVSAFH